MKKRVILLAVCLCALMTLSVWFASCQSTSDGTETSSSTDTQIESDVPSSRETEPATEPVTVPETEPATEPETEHVIVKPLAYTGSYTDWNETYLNVRDYGAKGDGVTDDTKAVRDVITAAYNRNGVAYFPEGQYLVTETITVDKNDAHTLRLVGNNAVLVGKDTLNGPILLNHMKYNFFMYNLDFIHNGQGECVDALYLQAQYCSFTQGEKNTADLVVFHGSDCRVIECTFVTANPAPYALSYIKQKDEISINDHIVDNVFRGIGKGIRVGDGADKEDGRCEGLKINGNYFYNSGTEQIRVSEILHISIAGNVLRNCTGKAIVLNQYGHGADGVYINDNSIAVGASAVACIATEPGEDNYVSNVNINHNTLCGGQYGIFDEVIISKAFVRENVIKNQSVSGYANTNTVRKSIEQVYMFFDNTFSEQGEVCSLTLTARGKMVFARNSIGAVNQYETFGAKNFPTDQINADISGNQDLSRREAVTSDDHNKYDGEENIGREFEKEEETNAPVEVPVVSDKPLSTPLYGSEKKKSNDAYLMTSGTELTAHFVATAHFTSVTVNCPSWGNSIGSIHAKLYRWEKNYDTTLAGEPIATADWIDFPDGNLNKIQVDNLPAGEYALVLTVDDKTTDAVGVWIQTRESTFMKVYKNGVLCDGLELNLATIQYTETPEVTLWEASPDR